MLHLQPIFFFLLKIFTTCLQNQALRKKDIRKKSENLAASQTPHCPKSRFYSKVYLKICILGSLSMTFRFSRALYNSATNLSVVHTRHKRLLLLSETCYPRRSRSQQNSQHFLYYSNGFLNVLLNAFNSRTLTDAIDHCSEGTLIRVALTWDVCWIYNT